MPGDTIQLLQRFREGDEAAYTALFQRYQEDLRQFVATHMDAALRRSVPPEDILQETHLEALRSLPGFTYRRELSFYFWLCGIARNRIHHHCRRLGRQPPPFSLSARAGRASGSSQDLLGTLQSLAPSPAEQTQLQEHMDLLAAALQALPDNQREAVVLRYVEGHDNAEAAAIARVEPGAFRVRLARGLLRLRELLAELLGEPGSAPQGPHP